MWVYEEEVNGKKLTSIINDQHENVRYLPGIKLPANVVATPDLCHAAKDADVLIFVLPHQFLQKACAQIKSVLKPGAYGVSLIKVSHCEEFSLKSVFWIFSVAYSIFQTKRNRNKIMGSCKSPDNTQPSSLTHGSCDITEQKYAGCRASSTRLILTGSFMRTPLRTRGKVIPGKASLSRVSNCPACFAFSLRGHYEL